MLCEKCGKNEATFYYHENVNGRTGTWRLCQACADAMTKSGELRDFDTDKLFEEFDTFLREPLRSMDEFFSGLFGGDRFALRSGEKKPGAPDKEEKKCPGCGMTLREFAARGRIGCPRCWETFEKELTPGMTRTLGTAPYAGHAPAKYRSRIEKRRRIEGLEAEQKEAVRREDYERAAEIRDELKKLREESVNPAVTEAQPQAAAEARETTEQNG